MNQWGFYFNQDRCIGCKACIMSCKNWNERQRGDAKINIPSEGLIMANADYTPAVGDLQPDTPFRNSTGAVNTAENGKYNMKEHWRRVTEHDSGAIKIDPVTNTYISTFDRAYLSVSCNHCTEPACVSACPMSVFHKDPDTGIVLYDSTGCISCGRCKTACPWDAPQFHDSSYAEYDYDDQQRPRMTKCTGCYDRITDGLKPACVAACRARALDFGPMEEIKSKYNHSYVAKAEGFDPDKTKPNIIFRAKTNVIT